MRAGAMDDTGRVASENKGREVHAPDLDEVVSKIQSLMGDAPADEVSCEITRHGTVKLVVKRGGITAVGGMKSGLRR